MNIEQLIVFKSIADTGTLRAAGENLGRTQPAISASLKQLEAHLGFELFSRETYRPTITPKGTRMLECTRSLLDAVQRWQEVADDLAGGCEPELCISIDSAAPMELIIPKINSSIEDFPSLKLDLRFGVITQGIDDLLSGIAQLAIAPMLVPHEAIEYSPLLSMQLIPCIHRKLLKDHRTITPAELRKIANIVVGSGNHQNPIGVPGLKEGKKIHVSNHAVKEQMITLGLGWGRIAEDSLTHYPELVPIRLRELPKVDLEICVAWKRDAALGPAARRVCQSLNELTLK